MGAAPLHPLLLLRRAPIWRIQGAPPCSSDQLPHAVQLISLVQVTHVSGTGSPPGFVCILFQLEGAQWSW